MAAGSLPARDAGAVPERHRRQHDAGRNARPGEIPSPAVRLPLLPARQDTIRVAASLLGQLRAAATVIR